MILERQEIIVEKWWRIALCAMIPSYHSHDILTLQQNKRMEITWILVPSMDCILQNATAVWHLSSPWNNKKMFFFMCCYIQYKMTIHQQKDVMKHNYINCDKHEIINYRLMICAKRWHIEQQVNKILQTFMWWLLKLVKIQHYYTLIISI